MNPNVYELRGDIPEALSDLRLLALDLRWSWSHVADALWRRIDETLWRHTRNPWLILQTVSLGRLQELARDKDFLSLVQQLHDEREAAMKEVSWFQRQPASDLQTPVAYFCMEYGLSESLPLYSGGLGVLAGDHLKTCSELGVPVNAVGLLYQQGYFRQGIDTEGRQLAFYPFNDPSQLPVVPVRKDDGEWLSIDLEFPNRSLRLRVWQAVIGRVNLYLLDSNDPLNDPADRGITNELYGGGPELRIQQEIVLGIGGYRVLRALGQEPQICHLNEGHAAFAVLERARSFAQQHAIDFDTALVATRAGNLFTSHTPVDAGFDQFAPVLVRKYLAAWAQLAGIDLDRILALGRPPGSAATEPFNMAWLGVRGSGAVNAVSRLHGDVSRNLFAGLFPHWPVPEVPVSHVTNGVHIPSRDSPAADRLWTESCGKNRWRGELEALEAAIDALPDQNLWDMRTENRNRLVEWIRSRRSRQQIIPGDGATLLDPNTLTLGFARRFAGYKRPNLLLHDPDRLFRLLTRTDRPVQLVLAGKAHPLDQVGKHMLQEWIQFISRYGLSQHVVFVVDYDLIVADRLVEGVDVWLNTPRRPWEACGTSGMKVLVNGGLNLSELDGWWAEAWRPEVGWALGDGREHDGQWDADDANQLYDLLEQQVIPAFYDRDAEGIPGRWTAMMRHSMAELTPAFSSNRMARQYTQSYYLPMAEAVLRRCRDGATVAKQIANWNEQLHSGWHAVRFGSLMAGTNEREHRVTVQVYLDGIEPEGVQVQLYADPVEGSSPECHEMVCGHALTGAINGYLYEIVLPPTRPLDDYTVRVIPHHPEASVPIENQLILWQR